MTQKYALMSGNIASHVFYEGTVHPDLLAQAVPVPDEVERDWWHDAQGDWHAPPPQPL